MYHETMKTIYVGTLAQQYFPQAKRHSAVTQLRRWVVRCKPLQHRLEELSFHKGQRMLTPCNTKRSPFSWENPENRNEEGNDDAERSFSFSDVEKGKMREEGKPRLNFIKKLLLNGHAATDFILTPVRELFLRISTIFNEEHCGRCDE